jgi:uncharacterized protein YqkB
VKKPSSWIDALALLEKDYANSLVVRALAEVMGRNILIVTANGVSFISCSLVFEVV